MPLSQTTEQSLTASVQEAGAAWNVAKDDQNGPAARVFALKKLRAAAQEVVTFSASAAEELEPDAAAEVGL